MAQASCDGLRGWLGSSVDHILVRKVVSETGKGCSKRKLCLARRLSIDQCDLMGKRVLMRLDLDVPVNDGRVSCTEKIDAAIPNIQLALLSGARSVVLMGHRGNPSGRPDKSLSLRPVAELLEKRLCIPVSFLEDCVGDVVYTQCNNAKCGSVTLLENLRFHKEEEGCGFDKRGRLVIATAAEKEQFRLSLSKLGDVYINDALAVSHLSHSSVVGCDIAQKGCGLSMSIELDCFIKLLRNPKMPFLAIVGGTKVSDKVTTIHHLLNHVTEMIIAGGMALAFLKVLHGMETGASSVDDNELQCVPQIMEQAASNGVSIHLPLDFIVADRCADNAAVSSRTIHEGIPAGSICVDIGLETRTLFGEVIERANTILWNGPPGMFEWEDFSHGSKAMMDAAVQATERGAVSVLLGGDTVTCAHKLQAGDKVTHANSGRTTLEILEGKILPGLLALPTETHKKCVMNTLSIDQCSLPDKRVVIRTDFDVPIHNGQIVSNRKIRDALPTILHAINHGAKSVVLVSHLDCPNGQPVALYSLEPVAVELQRLLEREVVFIPECVGELVENKCADPLPGSVFLLENLRFHPEEVGSHIDSLGKRTMASLEAVRIFRQSLSKLGDIFINDTFEISHTRHSSVVGIDLPVKAAGFQVMRELHFFHSFLYQPQRPLLAILGGLLLTGKIMLLDHLLDLADDVIIAGGLAFTFLKVLHGISIGSSLYDEQGASLVPIIVDRARLKNVNIHLPKDIVVANRFDPAAETRTINMPASIEDGWIGLDIGPKTQKMFADLISRARTVLWHGPPGVFEMDNYCRGTEHTVKAVVKATQVGAVTMIQGADTLACCRKFNAENHISRVCHENGVSVEHVLENELPGIEFLDCRVDLAEDLQQAWHTRLNQKKVEFCQSVRDRHMEALRKWTPPYTKKLPPLPVYQAPKPRIKYTGAPPPGLSIPSPYASSRKRFGPQEPGELGLPCRCELPPLLPKDRVPIQMETLVTLDNFDNLTVHINGASKNIPREADVRVTMVEGYVSRAKLAKKDNVSALKRYDRTRSAVKRRESSLSKFKKRINLTLSNEEFQCTSNVAVQASDTAQHNCSAPEKRAHFFCKNEDQLVLVDCSCKHVSPWRK